MPLISPVPRIFSLILTLSLLLWACGSATQDSAASSSGATKADKPAGQAGGGAKAEGEARDTIPVQTEPVKLQAISLLYATSATLRAERQATVTARARGVLERVEVEEGARVSAGQLLAQLEQSDARITRDRARLILEARADEARRSELLFAQKLLSASEHQAAERARQDAVHALEAAELALSRTRVTAPFAGVILKRYLDAGTTVADGNPLYDLADLDPLFLDVQVPERHVARLKQGQPVRLIIDSTGDVLSGQIVRLAPAVDTSSGTVKVTLSVGASTGLRAGSFVRVEIVTDTHPQAQALPRSALVAEGRRWLIYRLEPDGTHVKQLEVRTGFEEGERVEVLEVLTPGMRLASGDFVVTRGAAALSDGAAVEVLNPAPAGGAEVQKPGAEGTPGDTNAGAATSSSAQSPQSGAAHVAP